MQLEAKTRGWQTAEKGLVNSSSAVFQSRDEFIRNDFEFNRQCDRENGHREFQCGVGLWSLLMTLSALPLIKTGVRLPGCGKAGSPFELARILYPAPTPRSGDESTVTLIRKLEVRWFNQGASPAFARGALVRGRGAEDRSFYHHRTSYHSSEGRLCALASCETMQMQRSAFTTQNARERSRETGTDQREPELAFGPTSDETVQAWREQVTSVSDPLPPGPGSRPPRFLNGILRFALLEEKVTEWLAYPHSLTALRVEFLAPVYPEDRIQYAVLEGYRDSGTGDRLWQWVLEGRNQQHERVELVHVKTDFPVKGRRVVHTETFVERGVQAVPHSWDQCHPEPAKLALRCADGDFTWQTLQQEVRRWGLRLQRCGVGAGCVVAIHLGRHSTAVWMPMALASRQAVYFPLNPEDPPERLAFWLSKAQPDLIVTEHALLPGLPPASCPVYLIETLKQEAIDDTDSMERCGLFGDYLMGTSGSTGEPKLVHVLAAQVESYMEALAGALPVSEADVWLHTASFAFSASIRQLYLPLKLGGTLVLADEAARHDPRVLMRLIRHHGATIWDTVPSVWKRSIDYLQASGSEVSDIGTIRKIFLTGESLAWSLVQQWGEVAGHDAQLCNLYSQTETAGSVTCYRIPRLKSGEGLVPCGSPLPDIEVRLVDEGGHQVSLGELGEVWVSGRRFGGAVIRTGDLGKAGADHCLAIVGRKDRRVKVRGLAVDLDEIEKTLTSVQGVKEAAVAIEQADESGSWIKAYIVANQRDVPEEMLRLALRERLPSSHMPRAFAFLEALPRTTSGKLAWSRLPAQAAVASGFGHPQDDLEARLVEIWQRILGRKVGVRESFQELGGDSLAALDILLSTEKNLLGPLPAALLQELTTVADFAHKVRTLGLAWSGQNRPAATSAPLIQILQKITAGVAGHRPRPGSLLVRLNKNQAGTSSLFFCSNSLREAEPLAAELEGVTRVWFFQSGYKLIPSTKVVIQEVAAYYADEIMETAEGEPIRLLGYSFACQIVTEIAVQLQSRGCRVTFLGWLDNRNGRAGMFPFYRYLEGNWEGFVNRLNSGSDGQWQQGLASVMEALAEHFQDYAHRLRTWWQMKVDQPSDSEAMQAAIRYRTEPLNIPIHLFIAREHWLRNKLFPTLGWTRKDHPKLHIWPTEGCHLTLWHPGNAITLGRLLREALGTQEALNCST